MSVASQARRAFGALPNPIRASLKQRLLSIAAACHAVPYGAHFIFDLKRRLPNEHFSVVFDVGANTGQTIREFRAEFPSAKIFAFEPDPATFRQLKSNVLENDRVELRNIAFSQSPGRLRFDNTSAVTLVHGIAKNQNDDRLPWIDVTTIDVFCSENCIEHIDLLKIDTEGHDLEVIRGATKMLSQNAVNIVVAECSLIPDHPTLIPFALVQRELERHRYRLFGLFQQLPPWHSTNAFIMFANCAFVSEKVILRN